jgi:hypothetical protein
MYEALCDANAELWDQAAKAAGVPRRELHFTRSPEEALTDLWRRIDEDQSSQRRQRRWAMVSRISGIAAAACILIAIGVGWITLRNGNPSQPISGIAANSNGSSKGFVELVTGQGRKPLAMNQSVTTDGQPQEVLLGGIHRVVMNRNTKATFTAAPASGGNGRAPDAPQSGHDEKVPYEIQLARGELYVEVVPGHPFTVRTDNAQLDITGTKFNVLAEGDKTELTLLKGSVRFSQPVAGNAASATNSFVDVTTGHTSTITGRSAPIEPRETDAMTATAWARDLALTNAIALAVGQAGVDISGLFMMSQDFWRQSDPPDVDKLDYETWRDEHRQLGLRFMALTAVQKDPTVEADWIELLMISGDIWQFHYDSNLPACQPVTKLESAAVIRLVWHLGLDEQELLRIAGLPKSSPAAMSLLQDQTPGHRYADALRRWLDALTTRGQQPENDSVLKLFSLYASQYLAETRTAAYLWAKNHPEKVRQLLADKEYLAILPTPLAMTNNSAPDVNAWLEQIHDQANTARSCVPAAMEWLLAPQEARCQPLSLQKQRTLTGHVARLISIAGVGESESPCKLVIPANRGRLFMSCQKE